MLDQQPFLGPGWDQWALDGTRIRNEILRHDSGLNLRIPFQISVSHVYLTFRDFKLVSLRNGPIKPVPTSRLKNPPSKKSGCTRASQVETGASQVETGGGKS